MIHNTYFLKVEIDITGATSFVEAGVIQLVSVPYALYAQDVANKDDADASPTNEIQDLSLSGTDLSISNGSSIDLSILHRVQVRDELPNANCEQMNQSILCMDGS